MEKFKIGYTYSPATGEYTGKEIVYLEEATGKYPCAGNVTFKAPPKTGEHEAAVWNPAQGDWDIVPDYRGSVIYSPTSGEPIGEVVNLGHPENVIIEPPPAAKPHQLLEHVGGKWRLTNRQDWCLDEDGETWRPMTQEEKIIAGLEPMPAGYIRADGTVRPKTPDELWEDGEITAAQYNAAMEELREVAYRKTTDKIGLMVMRGEATMEEWQEAMQAIREKYPYKEA